MYGFNGQDKAQKKMKRSLTNVFIQNYNNNNNNNSNKINHKNKHSADKTNYSSMVEEPMQDGKDGATTINGHRFSTLWILLYCTRRSRYRSKMHGPSVGTSAVPVMAMIDGMLLIGGYTLVLFFFGQSQWSDHRWDWSWVQNCARNRFRVNKNRKGYIMLRRDIRISWCKEVSTSLPSAKGEWYIYIYMPMLSHVIRVSVWCLCISWERLCWCNNNITWFMHSYAKAIMTHTHAHTHTHIYIYSSIKVNICCHGR